MRLAWGISVLPALKNDHFREAVVRIRVTPVLALCATFSNTVLVSNSRDSRISRAAGRPFPAADTTCKAPPFRDRAFLNVRFCPNSETTPSSDYCGRSRRGHPRIGVVWSRIWGVLEVDLSDVCAAAVAVTQIQAGCCEGFTPVAELLQVDGESLLSVGASQGVAGLCAG